MKARRAHSRQGCRRYIRVPCMLFRPCCRSSRFWVSFRTYRPFQGRWVCALWRRRIRIAYRQWFRLQHTSVRVRAAPRVRCRVYLWLRQPYPCVPGFRYRLFPWLKGLGRLRGAHRGRYVRRFLQRVRKGRSGGLRHHGHGLTPPGCCRFRQGHESRWPHAFAFRDWHAARR